jgi:regulatory protein
MNKKITALKVQKRNSNRVNVFLDGEFAFGLARIVAAWLTIGQELTPEKIQDLKVQDAKEVAYLRAIKFISYRPRSRKEVVDNLKKHEVPEATIEEVLSRLEEIKLVDDVRFAEMWVDNRSDLRPRGRYALRAELRQKGLDDDTIEEAIADLDEHPLALAAAERKASRYASLEEHAFRQKLYGFLSRRGFSFDVIKPVVQELWNASQEEEHERNK